MNETTRASLFLLREVLENDPRSRLLDEKEVLLSASSEVARLSGIAKEKAEAYARASDSEDEAKKAKATKAFHEAKKALDEHPLCRDYQLAYGALRRLNESVEKILFGPFAEATFCGRSHD